MISRERKPELVKKRNESGLLAVLIGETRKTNGRMCYSRALEDGETPE